MKNLTKQQKKQILSSSNKIGTMVSFGNHEGKIVGIKKAFNDVILVLSYNTLNGSKITELSTDNVNVI